MLNLTLQLNEYLDYCKYQNNLSPKTLKAYRIDLTQFILYTHNKLTTDSIKQYISSLYQQYKIKTIKRKIASLKAFTFYLKDTKQITNNPFDTIKIRLKEPKLLPRIIPINIIRKLIKYPSDQLQNPHLTQNQKICLYRNIAILELLFATGVRISELCNLNIEDINFQNKFIKIMGKGSKERIIQIGNQDTYNSLKRYYNSMKTEINSTHIFFINRYHHRLSEQSVRNMIRTYVAKAHIKMKITPHMFRHTFATSLLEDNVDIRYIQKLLGHASITTTQIYTYVSLRKQKSIITKKNPMNKIHLPA